MYSIRQRWAQVVGGRARLELQIDGAMGGPGELFKDDLVEPDSSRMACKKLRGGAASHEERVLVKRGKFSKTMDG